MAAAGRRAVGIDKLKKLLDSQIDQALVYVETKDIDKPVVYASTCLTLARYIETAITSNAVPSPSHLPKLLLFVKEVYMRKAGLSDFSLVTLLIHIKSACQAGWYTDEDKDCLLTMADKASQGYYNLDNQNDEPTSVHFVSEIISRFYPRMKVELILASFDVKAGEGKLDARFHIAPNTVPPQNLWLLVARTDNMDTAACLISPSNVDFLMNDSEVLNRTRKQMGKGPQLPTNVTKMVKDGVNHLRVLGEFDGEYVISLAIMSFISSPDSSRLQDYVHPMSNDVESDCCLLGPSRVLLDCPFSGRRIRTPVKGHLCTHAQCFDYDFFMDANLMRPVWKCPVAHCNRPICNLDIRIDQTFLKILNEVAYDVGDVYIEDDGSWTVSLTEKSQINRDAMNQQNYVPGNTENLASLEANGTPTMSSLASLTIGVSAINMSVERPSTVEQPSLTTAAASLESNETPPVPSSALHTIGGSIVQCPSTVEQPSLTTAAVSLESNETPPVPSALHTIGGSIVQCPSTFEQPNITMPAVSLEGNETPPMYPALHNIGSFVIECPSTFEQPNVTTPPVFLEANGTPPMSSAFHSIGSPAINTTVECPSTSEQANVTTPAVDPPQLVKDSLLMPQSSCEVVHTPPLVQQTWPDLNPTATQVRAQALCQNSPTLANQPTEADNYNHAFQSSCDLVHTPPPTQQTRPDLNPSATQVPAQALCQNSPSLTNQPTEADNYKHAVQSSCDLVHTPPPTQQTRPNPNPTASHLPAHTQSQNSQTQTDQPAEADNGTCTSNQGLRRSIRARRTSVFTPVYLTPASAASVLRKLERRPRNTADEAQGTALVTPDIEQRGLKRKTTTIPAAGTEAQGTTFVAPVKRKRGRPRKQVSATHVPEASRDEISSVEMRGGLTGKNREAAEREYLAAPRQPIYANKPWPRQTTVPVEQLMKQLNVSDPRYLPH